MPDAASSSPTPVAARPPVSVVMPFAGDEAAARAALTALAGMQVRDGDERILADNSPTGVALALEPPPGIVVVPAEGEGSPARGRNAGALRATTPWLLFVDADCRPEPDVVDRFFDEPIGPEVGIVAGRVVDGAQTGLIARYSATRLILDQRSGLSAPRPWVLTANVLVRRETWVSLGGFLEGIFNGEDVDFCWRAQAVGWEVAWRPGAVVAHMHRETVRDLLRQAAVRRASARWVHRRWPEEPLPPLRLTPQLARGAGGTVVFALSGQFERAALKALDAAVAVAGAQGDLAANRARERPQPPAARRPVQLWCDQFPVVSETFIAAEGQALRRHGHAVEVLASRRPERPALTEHGLRVRYLEDDTRLERLRALAVVVARHPWRSARDLVARRRWRREEDVVPLRQLAPAILRLEAEPRAHPHAHFAAGAALHALRAAAITGRPWSLACHGYDIYKLPRNLPEKVRRAELVVVPCDYCVRDVREIAGPDRADRVQRVVMGVEPGRFRRRTPHPAEGYVLGVGRLVPKKGFVDLVRAMGKPALAGARLVLIGEGPERDLLLREARALGLGQRLELRGRAEHDDVREALEGAAVLAMPCVVAPDGDRDSMPVVVKEAMAMEVPVVVTDEVGLPELVTPECGRLVPPGDADALAGALAEVLALDAQERGRLGAAGRERVARVASLDEETARLSDLLEEL